MNKEEHEQQEDDNTKRKYWSGTPFQDNDDNDKRKMFWKSTPQEYATAQTDGLDENKKLVAYPLAYLFRSLFTRNFWMFALISIIIFISFRSIITNDL
jgi:hypothetical protein